MGDSTDAALSAVLIDNMDLETLMQWKLACRASLSEVNRGLRRTLHDMILRFLPRPKEFLRILTECHALIGGVFALAFMLRDPTVAVKNLDLYTSEMWFQVLLEYLVYSPFISHHTIFNGISHCTVGYRRKRTIRRRAFFVTSTGLHIQIHESCTVSACSPIAGSWTTALMNFVTENSFGCAYPRLTLQRRGLLSDLAMDSTFMTQDDFRAMAFMLLHNVHFALDATAFPEFRQYRVPDRVQHIIPCLRHLYLCPDQGRYFGDPGCLLAFIHPLCETHSDAQRRRVPPYGFMVAWRLWTSYVCEGRCAYNDYVLQEGIVAIPTLFVDNHVFRRGEAEGAPQSDDSHLSLRRFRTRGRRRAVSV